MAREVVVCQVIAKAAELVVKVMQLIVAEVQVEVAHAFLLRTQE